MNKPIETVEGVWNMRAAVIRAAEWNPSYRDYNPDTTSSEKVPRLEGMDSLDSLEFLMDLEEECDVNITDEEADREILKGRNYLGLKELGEIARYLYEKSRRV